MDDRKLRAINKIKELVRKFSLTDEQVNVLVKKYPKNFKPYKHLPQSLSKEIRILFANLN